MWRATCSCSPVAQVQEIVTDRTAAEFGDWWEDALELVLADAFENLMYEFLVKPCFDSLFR